MPYINLQITKDGVTKEQKTQIVAEFTQTLARVLGKRPDHTHVVIQEIETDNWGFSGMLTTDFRKMPASPGG
jgi:4-oxalocrotonate tautomerase